MAVSLRFRMTYGGLGDAGRCGCFSARPRSRTSASGRPCSLERVSSTGRLPRSAGRVVEPASRHRAVRARSVTMVLCAREDAPPFPRCARSACGASTAKRRVALPAYLAEGRPRSHDRIVMPFHECATSHPRLPISSVSEMAAPGAAGAKQATDIGYDNSEGTAFMPVCG